MNWQKSEIFGTPRQGIWGDGKEHHELVNEEMKMKNKLGMFATLLSVALLTIYPNDLRAQDNEKPWQCKGNCRTWIVIASTTAHMAVGDKFQIRKYGATAKFSAQSQLRGRWKKPALTPLEFDLTRSGPAASFSEETRFCGFIDVDSAMHADEDHGVAHIFKIKLIDKNMLKITWGTPLSDPTKTLVQKCEALDESHGGIVHAEPN